MKKLRVEEVIVVEGKYDAAKLADLVDGLILTTNGFSVFKNAETKRLLVELGKKRGIIVLTDSDDAGFRIRNYINKLVQGICVKNAYVPAIAGKERRKAQPSKEGVLGVEGVPSEAILRALQTAGAGKERAGRAITYTDLYELGLSGTEESAGVRRAWLQSLGLPPRLSKSAVRGAQQSVHL
ncbi:MAG: toprim domain-containing protein [Ruthenibacterium lactatiformans]